MAYFVTEANEAGVFVTQEHYSDQASLDAHNNGHGAKEFFVRTEGHIDRADIVVGTEIFP